MRTCDIEGCDQKHLAKGMCRRHYERAANGYNMDKPYVPKRTGCDIDGCDRPHYAKGMCNPHWQQARQGRSGPLRDTHGERWTRLYRIWSLMKGRCDNQNLSMYRYYGGRGITYTSEWATFMPFHDWAYANGYADPAPGTPTGDALSIERIDPDGDYCPENCEWIPMRENSRRRQHARA